MSDPCPICGGGMAKKDCICGGTGKLINAFNHTSERWLREKNEHEQTKAALQEMQKAVLGFIFNPVFRKLDRNGFFRRYWEDKLQCQLSFNAGPRIKVKPLEAAQQVPKIALYSPPTLVNKQP